MMFGLNEYAQIGVGAARQVPRAYMTKSNQTIMESLEALKSSLEVSIKEKKDRLEVIKETITQINSKPDMVVFLEALRKTGIL